MKTLWTYRECKRSLTVAAVSLYAIALLLGAVHPLLHEAQADSDHLGYGICGTGCDDHHNGVEKCATCATLIKKVSNPQASLIAFGSVPTSAACSAESVFFESGDTQLPGLRAPPAVA